MEWPQKYFEIIYKILRQQNKLFLKDISMNEKLPLHELEKDYLPSKKHLKIFFNQYHQN